MSWALSVWALVACSPPAPAAAPVPPAPTNVDPDPSISNSPPTEDVEACRERILNEGVPAKKSGKPEGSELAQQAETARKSKDGPAERAAYLALMQKAPSSPYVPFAYFEFAELFQAESASDPTKLPLAEEAIKEAIKLPAPANRLYLVATYRLGQIYELEKKKRDAHDAYQHAVEEAGGHDDWDCATPVAEAAQGAVQRMSEAQEEEDENR